LAEQAIKDGSGFRKLRELVMAQGGDVSYVDDLSKLPKASFVESVYADKAGWAAVVDAKEVGETSSAWRWQRTKRRRDRSGCRIMVRVKVGDPVTGAGPV
jgi:pyrimidine-nucleoside phosphorylase